MTNLSKERLREIELELQGWTPHRLQASENITQYMTTEQFKEDSRKGGRVTAAIHRKNKIGLFGITKEQRIAQSKKNQNFYTTCPHCGKREKGGFFVTIHIPKCILQFISLDDFIQEWKNPTMKRHDFAKKIGVSPSLIYKFKNELIDTGVL